MTSQTNLIKLHPMNPLPEDSSSMPLVKAGAALVLATCLQGCVAMAIPAIAGGVIAREEIQREQPTPQSTSSETSPVEAPAGTNSSSQTARNAPANKESEFQEFEIASDAAVAAFERRDMQGDDAVSRSPQSLAELAAADLAQQISRPEPIYTSGFHAITSYTLKMITADNESKPTSSALLSNPSQLDGQRRSCSTGNPAILIDLDEQGRAFDPETLAPTYDGDSFGHLSRLREAGVTIGWSSALAAGRAGEIRKALRRSGLDVAGQDTLVLLRYPQDRKQTRRSEFGAEHCLIAIAGDERMDFDELFEYLITPDAAVALEPLIGNGWFLLEEGLPARSEAPQQ